MTKVNTFIEVGICSSYGDGDFGVSTSVTELSDEQFKNLIFSALTAIEVARKMRQPPPQQAAQMEQA